MSRLIVDTDVCSFLLKGDTRADRYAPHIHGNELVLSIMSVAELYQWAAVRDWGIRRTAQLESYLEQHYEIAFVDMITSRLWGEIRAEQRKLGRALSPQDAWIAATALQLDLVLLSHNAIDFTVVPGLRVISEPD